MGGRLRGGVRREYDDRKVRERERGEEAERKNTKKKNIKLYEEFHSSLPPPPFSFPFLSFFFFFKHFRERSVF